MPSEPVSLPRQENQVVIVLGGSEPVCAQDALGTWSSHEDGDDVVDPAGSSSVAAHQIVVEPDN